MRGERRLGQLLLEQKKNEGGRTEKTGSAKEPVDLVPTLSDMGIDKKLSSRAQKVADSQDYLSYFLLILIVTGVL